jgi:hypothetical protein
MSDPECPRRLDPGGPDRRDVTSQVLHVLSCDAVDRSSVRFRLRHASAQECLSTRANAAPSVATTPSATRR